VSGVSPALLRKERNDHEPDSEGFEGESARKRAEGSRARETGENKDRRWQSAG
jgi:hypothetical protein